MLRAVSLLALFLAGPLPAAGLDVCAYDRVEVAPATTSIYVGRVTLTMPGFIRDTGVFVSSYTAKVFPYFFYNERGTLTIGFSDEMLRQLARGEPVEFTGHAINSDGAGRRVAGRATPSDAASGKIKVRVFYSKRVELIFNTIYRFPHVDNQCRSP